MTLIAIMVEVTITSTSANPCCFIFFILTFGNPLPSFYYSRGADKLQPHRQIADSKRINQNRGALLLGLMELLTGIPGGEFELRDGYSFRRVIGKAKSNLCRAN